MAKIQSVTSTFGDPQITVTVRDVPETARVVVLFGPNGGGKSMILEALMQRGAVHGSSLTIHGGMPSKGLKVYARSAYRIEGSSKINWQSALQSHHVLPLPQITSRMAQDARLQTHYQRTISHANIESHRTSKTWSEAAESKLSGVRSRISRVLPQLELAKLDDPADEKWQTPKNVFGGTFQFMRNGKAFDFNQLSAGEREVVGILADLELSMENLSDAVLCIDEPELHLHTELQARLMEELESFISPDGQLWIATHSIGMIRKALEFEQRHPGGVAFLEFASQDQQRVVVPAMVNRSLWSRVFTVALGDLANLIAPSTIVICEGRHFGAPKPDRAGFDARVYSAIFSAVYPDAAFVPGGSCNDIEFDSIKLGATLSRLLPSAKVIKLIDRDDQTEEEIGSCVQRGLRTLSRRSVENYLWSDEILVKLCNSLCAPERLTDVRLAKMELLGKPQAWTDGDFDHLKDIRGPLFAKLRQLLPLDGRGNSVEGFSVNTLAPLITPDTKTYGVLHHDIFG